MVLGGSRDPLPVVSTGVVVDPSSYKFLAIDMVANKDSQEIIEFFGVLPSGFEKWQYVWNTENDTITIQNFVTPPLDGFNGSLFTIDVFGDWVTVACSDCTAPFVSFYDRDEFTLDQTYPVSGSYGQAKFNLAWYLNDFNAYNVFVTASGNIDMVEIFTPPATMDDNQNVLIESPATQWNFHENIFNLDQSFFEGF